MHPIDSSPISMTGYRKPGGHGSFAICLMLLLIGLFVPATATARDSTGCSGPIGWTDTNNPFVLNKDSIGGVYIAKVHKSIEIGFEKLNSDDFYSLGSIGGKKMKWKIEGDVSLYLKYIEIVEKFTGDLDIGARLFVLWMGFPGDEYGKPAIDAVVYEFDQNKIKPKYITLVTGKTKYFRNINHVTGRIANSTTFLSEKIRKRIYKYTENFIWPDDCLDWPVDDIYNGVDYPVVRFIEKFIAPRNSAARRP